MTDKFTIVYDDFKKELKQKITQLPYFNDAKLFLITIRRSLKNISNMLESEIRFGILDPGDLVQASNLYTRM